MKNKILTICIFLIILTAQVSAFGVTAFYYKEHPLILNPGDTKDVQLILQNEQTSDPVTIKAKIENGMEIAEITGKTMFDLAPGQDNVRVNIKITIPETAKIGDEYNVGVQFKTTAREGSEMMAFGTKISKGIPIVIGEVIKKPEAEPEAEPPLGIIYGIAIVLAVLVLVILYKKRKTLLKKKPKKKK